MEEELKDKLCKAIDKSIESMIVDGEIREEDIKPLGELIDMKKDLANMKYWKVKEEDIMRYGNYGRGEYGEGYGRRSRDSRGRYTEGSYGRRGIPGSGRGRYRGEDMMDEMYDAYREYNEGREEYNRSGNYGAKEDSMKGLERMMMSVSDCIYDVYEVAEPEEKELIEEHVEKLHEKMSRM